MPRSTIHNGQQINSKPIVLGSRAACRTAFLRLKRPSVFAYAETRGEKEKSRAAGA